MPNPNTTFTAGAILTAAQQNRLPWGVVGYVQKASNQTITTEADLSGLSISWTAVAGRVYKFTACLNLFSTSASEVTIFLNDGSTNIKESLGTNGAGEVQTRTVVYYVTGITAGLKTYKLRGSGTSSTIVYGETFRASIASQFIVEDMGPI